MIFVDVFFLSAFHVNLSNANIYELMALFHQLFTNMQKKKITPTITRKKEKGLKVMYDVY